MDRLELWRTRKKELGLTNKQIAEKANLPLRTVEQIMCGTVKAPRLDSVEAIERALGINEKSPPAEQEGLKVPDSLKPYQFAFFEGMDGLSEESVKDILKYVDYVKSKENKEKK